MYKAPITDMKFALRVHREYSPHLVHSLPDDEMIDVIPEAGKLAGDVIAPLNHSADKAEYAMMMALLQRLRGLWPRFNWHMEANEAFVVRTCHLPLAHASMRCGKPQYGLFLMPFINARPNLSTSAFGK